MDTVIESAELIWVMKKTENELYRLHCRLEI